MPDLPAHVRIDEGIPRKRPGRRPAPRKAVDRSPKSGQWVSLYPPELKAQVIEECQTLIALGHTPAEIGARHGIPARTVQYWLLGDEKAEAARGQLIAAELARTLDDMRQPEDPAQDSPLRLARAREEFRAWSWIAERREARLYGQKQEITHNITGISEALQAISQKRLESQPIEGEIIDKSKT